MTLTLRLALSDRPEQYYQIVHPYWFHSADYIRSSYELLLKVLGYEFLPRSLPSLALFLNLFLAHQLD